MKPTIQELDAAIEYLKPFANEEPDIDKDDTPEEIEREKQRVATNKASYAALKFAMALMKPSDNMYRSLFGDDKNTPSSFIIKKFTNKAWEEVAVPKEVEGE